MKSLLKWVGGAVLVLVLLVGVLAGVGATQPRDHEASRTITLDRPAAEVFAILEDVAAYPCWRTNVSGVDILGAQPLRFVEHSEGDSMRFAVVEREPPRRLVVKIDDEELPFGGTWTYELSPQDSGTAVTITERGFVDNPIVRGMATLMMDPTDSIVQFQDDLAEHRQCP